MVRAKNEMRERGERGEGSERENVRRERGREKRVSREREKVGIFA